MVSLSRPAALAAYNAASALANVSLKDSPGAWIAIPALRVASGVVARQPSSSRRMVFDAATAVGGRRTTMNSSPPKRAVPVATAHRGRQIATKALQHLITDLVTQPVVDVFEVVQIQNSQCVSDLQRIQQSVGLASVPDPGRSSVRLANASNARACCWLAWA